MTILLPALAVIVVVLLVTGASRRFGLPAPLILTVVGVGGSFLPFLPTMHLDPDLVLIGILPPLLYAAAIRSSLVDFRDNKIPIGFLSIGLVVVTALGVGVVAWWVLPIPFAAAFALGAVVGPPDAVAATAIARRIRLPRRIVTLLEGESLVNDATALVLLSTAIGAIGGSFNAVDIGLSFAVSALGGLLIGIVTAFVVNWIQHRFSDPVTSTALSLITPFAAFLAADSFGGSGVLAVVIAGLLIAHQAPRIQTASARLSTRTNWTAIQFLLENGVFLLIGLQMRTVLSAVSGSEVGAGTIAAACAAVLAAVIFLRPAWVFLGRLVAFRRGTDRVGTPTPWRHFVVLSWAGMRGVVTLAAAFILPPETPQRQILVLAAMVVTAATLLVQGSTLPLLARLLRVHGPDPREDALQEATVLQSAVTAGLVTLDELSEGVDRDTIEQLRRTAERRTNVIWERLGDSRPGNPETPSEAYRRIRLQMLAVEREAVLAIRDEGQADHEVLEHLMNALDMEESMLGTVGDRSSELSEDEPMGIAPGGQDCEHLEDAPAHVAPKTPNGCPDCEREGTKPVQLRLCLECGNVGCCDSSEGRHARRHYESTGHPAMRSFEPGENWRWCFVDGIRG